MLDQSFYRVIADKETIGHAVNGVYYTVSGAEFIKFLNAGSDADLPPVYRKAFFPGRKQPITTTVSDPRKCRRILRCLLEAELSETH